MRNTMLAVACLGLLALTSSTALAWGSGTHQKLAVLFYQDPIIAGFAAEFGTPVSTVTSGAGDLDFVGDPHHGIYHSGQWLMVINREYVYKPASPTDWFALDETTRLKYMMHNLGDVAVPIGHSPANTYPGAGSGTMKEAYFEGQADILNAYGNPSLYSGSSYTGTVSQCIDQYYTEHMANVAYFAANVSEGFLTVTPKANASASAHTAWAFSQKLAKVILTDYYLAKRSAATGAAKDVTVGPGQTALFSAADVCDPDNIVWDSNGTYSSNLANKGIAQVRWDINGDGIYETTGLEASFTYSQLIAMFGPNALVNYGIEVTDDEGNVSTDFGSLQLIPEPMSLLLLSAGVFALPRRKKNA